MVLLFSVAFANAISTSIRNPLVEGLTSPLSVPSLSPRFSWELDASPTNRNLTQTNYHVRVRDNYDAPADVCDTGIVASSASTLVSITCVGRSNSAFILAPGRTYFWDVSIVASDGSIYSMTRPSNFSVGLQGRSDWSPSAHFVGSAGGVAAVSNPWLRSPIFTPSAAQITSLRTRKATALLHIASYGFHEAFLNGFRLENTSVLIPSVSDLRFRVLSHTYDVTQLLATHGTAPSALGIWAFGGWATLDISTKNDFQLAGVPLVMAELRFTPQQASAASIALLTTNAKSGWRISESSMQHLGLWEWGNYGGEYVDHGKDDETWATAAGSTVGAGWSNVVNGDAALGTRVISPEHLESIGIVERIAAVSVTPCRGPAPSPPAPSPPAPSPPAPSPHNSDCTKASGLLGGVRAECGIAGPCVAHDWLNLTCASGGVMTKIDFASWGTPTGSCSALEGSACNATNSYEYVAKACLGKSHCSLLPRRDNFGTDPCFKVAKTLAVQVSGCTPARAASAAEACYVVKMEKLLNGWLDVAKLPAAAGANITFQYSSDAKQTLQWNAIDTVTTSASATGFKNRFNWHEFQYITVTGTLNAAPLASDFVGLRLMNKMPKVGSFTSSNEMLNKVYDGHVATNEGLTIGGMFVDCPNRERFGYGGDSQTHIEFALATYSSSPFFAKWSRDWADAGVGNGKGGVDDGSLPNSAPTYQGSGGPAWGLISVKLPWELFLQSGDLRALNASYYTTKRFLALLTKSVDETTGIFNTGSRMLADWQSVSSYAESPDAQILFNSAYLVYQLKLAVRTATALGEMDDAMTFAATAQKISMGVHATYYDAAKKTYFARENGNVSYQGFNVVALMAGLVPSAGGVEDDVLATLEHQITVEKSGHLDTGLFNTYLMATLLSSPRGSARKRHDDLLLTMATIPTYPGYGWLITQGLGTWPETWKIGAVAGGKSLIHGCMNGFGLWFPQGILGVRADPDFPGFSRFTVRPAFSINIMHAEGKVATPRGAVSVSWTTPSATATTLKLVVPFNSIATVWLPATAASAVSEGGKPATSSATFMRQDGADTVWEVGSGEYAFATS